MSVGQCVLGGLRLIGIMIPTLVAARRLRSAYVPVEGALGLLTEGVLALSVLLLCAELLGLVGLDHSTGLIAMLLVVAIGCWRATRDRSATGAIAGRTEARRRPPGVALAAVAVVVAQWLVQTADALGGGMLNFDTLWYHMPFAARFAQTGSVTGVLFVQADPFIAYYPANSELFHAVGIVALHNDFLSPFLNLLWLALALLACWCIGRPWQVEAWTLIAGALVLSLPVLSSTQPGEAFDDIVGLATMLAGVALLVNGAGSTSAVAVAGLALGLSIGTKLTFVVPVLALILAAAWLVERGRRRLTFVTLAGASAVTGGWWYLRALIRTGSPLGLRLHLGPITLPGPVSQAATTGQQTVFAELRHPSLWTSRVFPGLEHALGPVWPAIVVLFAGATLVGLLSGRDRRIRLVALTATLAGISYLFLPTGATAIEQGTTIFQVNVRYATPALALGFVLLPVLVRLHVPRLLRAVGPELLAIVIVTQFESALWPAQPGRHLAFLAGLVVLGSAIWQGRRLRAAPVRVLVGLGVSLAVAGGGAAYAVQRHYFEHRYIGAAVRDPSLGPLFSWAQQITHARIALYGTVEQYPLYGAQDTNTVQYVGDDAGDGGYRRTTGCAAWRAALNRGRYDYVLIARSLTTPIPVSWTSEDRAAHQILATPGGGFVFRISGRFSPASCARG